MGRCSVARERLATMNPFPGMNPYIEQPRFWRGFHNKFIALLEDKLNEILPPGFAANSEERITVIPPGQSFYPDVPEPWRTMPPQAGGTATLEPDTQHGVLVAIPETNSEMFIEISSVNDWEQVITVIEILSPTNKAEGREGFREYYTKQQALLQSQTSLVEIDLLRAGAHSVAAPFNLLKRRGNWDHIVSVHRYWQSYHFEFWLNLLSNPLPTISIPLLEGMEDTQIALQPIVDYLYERGPYPTLIKYNQPPPVPLREEQSAWMDVLLREKGLRT